ncbi:malonate--CoA ligase ACSF3, mitochondrial-like [Tubulanus polymorphus]
MAGATLVPLCRTHPAVELQYFVEDSHSKLIITTEHYEDVAQTISMNTKVPYIVLKNEDYNANIIDTSRSVNSVAVNAFKKKLDGLVNSRFFQRRNAMIIYTSGTTGKPKGVVLTHANLHAQTQMMRISWAWSHKDVILHCLPLHHIHGVINLLLTPLMSGATCVMMPKFDAKKVWTKLIEPIKTTDDSSVHVNMFMAVPTVYVKLIQYFTQNWSQGRGSRQTREHIKSVCKSKIRLMVSGSSALPEPVMTRWEEITGHRMLERYGMTELGMVLTNPLKGDRIPGAVGNPFPGVEVCLARHNVYSPIGYDVIAEGNSQSTKETPGFEGESGELYVKGPGVFKCYFNKPEATNASFTKDGWFKTGDTMCYVNGVYKILGRTSVDLIKSGGYKISALDVERHLMAHPDIIECCVVGLPDLTWGQRVAAVVVLHDDAVLTLDELKTWASDKMPHYHIPTVLKELPEMPRNAMGKINKKMIVEDVFPEFLKQKD